ncbi:fluoride efflux transporter CrcB [Sediminibacillus dalangtanensis]|uniref:Fluoride-specific ion channel FluC n=1 Tax=Sediminibacillus dalangtanensis TaxID=2729421 RepID=A0ABX7VTN9_9BACI|nr:CrcB family protein [Sediminibacillus dalangtanensis]QTN00245.1 fluoride efflux transporter CrcB [Sediminibacillus dalangtanensis]
MSEIVFILVGIGGFVGAIARFAISQLVKRNFRFTIPAATVFVNVAGSFLLGLLNGLHVGEYILLLAGTGFCGAFTTFSTFKLEAVQLHLREQKRAFIFYTIFTYAGGIALAFVGYQLGMLFH